MIDAHSAESNEKSIFLFLLSELWLIAFTIIKNLPTKKKVFKCVQIYIKDVEWAETSKKSIFRFL